MIFTTSVFPSPAHTLAYVAFGIPPAYPTSVDVTPATSFKSCCGSQNHWHPIMATFFSSLLKSSSCDVDDVDDGDFNEGDEDEDEDDDDDVQAKR